MLTNDIVSFEQLGPGELLTEMKKINASLFEKVSGEVLIIRLTHIHLFLG